MLRAGWEKRSFLLLAIIALAGGATCPFNPALESEGLASGGIVTLRIENQSGLPAVVTAKYSIDDTEVRETVRKLEPNGDDAIATVLPTRTRLLEVTAVVGDKIDPTITSVVKPGDMLREGKFQWQVDFRSGDTFVFVIPPLGTPEPPGGDTVDCNTNGIIDALDIANGTSLDCDNDGIPDECDTSLAPHDPFPADGATDVATNVLLKWNQLPPIKGANEGRPIPTVEKMQMSRTRAGSATSLSEFYSATGRLYVSIDGGGSNNASHIIEVEKPNATATVRKAFVIAVSTGFSGRQLSNGDVQINPPGVGVTWSSSVQNSIFSFNHLADMTAALSPAINSAPAGRIAFSFSEINTAGIDGEALIVVFDDSQQPADQTVILLFGAQNIAGDSFAITLAEPINPEAAGATATMSLGISYGFQPTGQVSLIDVNGQRLTSSAGGQDDGPPGCSGGNGSLITVGGLDDSIDNPPDPFAGASSCRSDDEYYSLLPLIASSDTQIVVDTLNPSNDDNIFFGAFVLSGAAVLGEGVVLGPTSATSRVGATHTVVATVANEESQPVIGRNVTFTVLTGPNQGVNGIVATDAAGQARFSYAGVGGVGIDQIQATFIDSQAQSRNSNIVTKEWTPLCALHFTVLLDTNPKPTTPVCADVLDATCRPLSLTPGTTYFWQVTANDGAIDLPGPVWSFTTTAN